MNHAPIYHLKMVNCQLRPFILKVFEDQSSVTMIRGRFAAKQGGRHGKRGGLQLFFYMPIRHQRAKSMFVFLPASFSLLIVIKHLFSRSEQRLVHVFRTADFTQEILKVFALGETSQL